MPRKNTKDNREEGHGQKEPIHPLSEAAGKSPRQERGEVEMLTAFNRKKKIRWNF